MTLVELLLGIGITGILTGAVISHASRHADRGRVVLAQAAILDAYRHGRAAAQALHRPAEVLITADSIVVRSLGLRDTILIRRRPGPAGLGVTASPDSHRTVYAPSGMTIGVANVTHRLARGPISRAVVVSRLGRIRVH